MQSLETAGSNEIFLLDNDPYVLIDMFKTKLPLVQAAGGLVRNNKGKMLFIFRKNKWDLPKGKVDKGETLENGAMREVEEETGVKKLQPETGLNILKFFKPSKIFKRVKVFKRSIPD